jgi:tetratricopeptide (TPR) repeat protein
VRLTASKRGIGISAGVPGARYSVHSSGRRTATVGVPGTGMSYSKSQSGGRASRSAPAESAVAAPAVPKAGLLAPKYEKEFARGVRAYVSGDVAGALAHFRGATVADTSERSVADDLFTGLLAAQTGDNSLAAQHLEKVVVADQPLPDALMLKYASGGEIEIGVTPSINVTVELGTVAAALTLAEVYQRDGRLDEAIGILQQLVDLERVPALVLSLCDLYAEQQAWDEIVDVASGTRNDDDITLGVRLFHAEALVQRGIDDGALEVYRDCLRSRKRDPELLKEARYGRALLYRKSGKKTQARKDLGVIYADDPHYRDVRALLED